MKKIITGLFIFCAVLNSCEPPVKKLGANPKVSYFIVGRLSVTGLYDTSPFNVKVLELKPELIEKPFDLNILDENSFELSYSITGKQENATYQFGQEINNKNMHLVISETKPLDSVSVFYLKNINYQFRVSGE